MDQNKNQRYDSAIVDFLRTYTKSHGYSPCMREIAQEFSLQTTYIQRRLRFLRNAGIIFFTDHTARSYIVIERTPTHERLQEKQS